MLEARTRETLRDLGLVGACMGGIVCGLLGAVGVLGGLADVAGQAAKNGDTTTQVDVRSRPCETVEFGADPRELLGGVAAAQAYSDAHGEDPASVCYVGKLGEETTWYITSVS